jgi:hypothetical protein
MAKSLANRDYRRRAQLAELARSVVS